MEYSSTKQRLNTLIYGNNSTQDRLNKMIHSTAPANEKSKAAVEELQTTGKTTLHGKTYTLPESQKKIIDRGNGITDEQEASDTTEQKYLPYTDTGDMTVEDYEKLISDTESQIKWYNDNNTKVVGAKGGNGNFGVSVVHEYDDAISEAENQLEEYKAGLWNLQNSQKYAGLSSNADYAEKSTTIDETQGKLFGDQTYAYINNLNDAQSVAGTLNGSGGKANLTKYKYMTDEQKANYNYLYNTEGKESAEDYLDYISYGLNATEGQEVSQYWSDIAGKNAGTAAAASAASTLTNLASGVGFLDVAAQNAKRKITGEYQPIDYNSPGMRATEVTQAIRGTVTEKINENPHAVISIDEEKHPVLATFLNGKSLGDVYNLGMSMVDSSAVAALGAVTGIGGAGTVLLGGSAASQGILDALDKGATDEQALTMGFFNGLYETLFEYVSVDKIFDIINSKSLVSFGKALWQQTVAEGSEEFFTTLFNDMTDALVMAEKSDWQKKIAGYLLENYDEETAKWLALRDTAVEMMWDFIGGAISGGIMGGTTSALKNTAVNIKNTAETGKAYQGSAAELAEESKEITGSKLANRVSGRLESGKKVSDYALGRLVNQNETALVKQDEATIREAAKKQLEVYGETGNTEALAKAIIKQVAQGTLTRAERQLIASSKYGQRVLNELTPENIENQNYTSDWAERLNTERINAEDYSRLLRESENNQTPETPSSQLVPDTNVGNKVKNTASRNTPKITMAEAEENPQEALQKEAESYGAQAGAFTETYNEGQDVYEYSSAFRSAYDYAESGVSFNAVNKLDSVSYLTEAQRRIAYDTGYAARSTAAEKKQSSRDSEAAENTNTGRRIGTVKYYGNATELNETQKQATRIIRTISEGTGLDVALYNSYNEDTGTFRGENAAFSQQTPDTIYLDINAGLQKAIEQGEEAKYILLRSFSHDFTHWLAHWSPKLYNEFQEYVFEEMEQNGQNPTELIDEAYANQHLKTKDAAAQEVVGEAMTDILPQSRFMENLVQQNRTLAQRLVDRLKSFLSDIKAYFKTIKHSTASASARATMQKVEEGLRYTQELADKYDVLVMDAVERYQRAYAIEEQTTITEDVQTEETRETEAEKPTEEIRAEAPVEEAAEEAPIQAETPKAEETPVQEEAPKAEEAKAEEAPKTTTSKYGYTITDNPQYNSIEVKFSGKPSEQVRNALKALKFRWNGKRGVWYGKATHEHVLDVLDSVYAEEAKAPAQQEAPKAEEKPKAQEKKPFTGDEIFNQQAVSQLAEDMQNGTAPQPVVDIIEALPKAPKEETAKAEPVEEAQPKAMEEQDEDIRALASFNEKEMNLYNRLVVDGADVIINGFEYTVSNLYRQDGMVYRAKINRVTMTPIPIADARALYNGTFDSTHAAAIALVQIAKDYRLLEKTADENTQREETPNETVREPGVRGETLREDNAGGVRQSDTNRAGDARLLDELQAEAVQEHGGQRDTSENPAEKRKRPKRHDRGADSADRGSGRNGNGESGVHRGNDGLTEQTEAAQEQQAKEEALKEETTQQIEEQSKVEPKGQNFVITDSLNLPKGEKARFRANIDAIRLVKQLQAEDRYATAAEQEILSKYVGWGGLSDAFGEMKWNSTTKSREMVAKSGWENEHREFRKLVEDGIITEAEYEGMSASTKNAHYTSVEVIKAMYDGLKQLGFTGGRMLEPSSGVGNFVGAMPAEMSGTVKSWTMVELDPLTGAIAKYLYPNADVRIQGFETANIPGNYIDVAIGNVPFGKYGVVDRSYPGRITKAIHNYFFAKSLDKVRTGGIVMFITSSFTMNSEDTAIRQYIMDRADLLGAIRLPNTAFSGNAGTQVVTDILVLKKRAAGTEYAGEAFLDAPYIKIGTGWNESAYVNEYFEAHPEMVLGTAVMKRGMYSANTLTYDPLTDKGSLGDQIRSAFQNIKGKMDYPAPMTPEKSNFAVEKAQKKGKKNGLSIGEDGKLYRNNGGKLETVTATQDTVDRVNGMLKIRDAYRSLINYIQQGQDAKYIKQARKALNDAYDSFVKEYGYLNDRKNKAAFDEDPDSYSILSLENLEKTGKRNVFTVTKADIFTKDTIKPNVTINHVDDLASGVIVSINRKGSIDAEYIAQLTGKTTEQVTRELIDSRMAFKTREGWLEAPQTYLSGNVRAKLREAEALAPLDSDYQNNVEELKKVLPKDIPSEEIYVAVGSPWVPNSVYADFIAEMLGGHNVYDSYYGKPDIEVSRTNTGEFKIAVNNKNLRKNAQNKQVYGTKRRTFLDLMETMLASRTTTVNDQIEDADGRKRAVLNKDETAAARAMAEKITKEFQQWLWQDETRKKELSSLYNETFNALVTPKYSGENLTVNGLNATFTLKPHQADAVQRVISSGGNTLLAHKVGAGKTLEMAASAMKLRELGIVKKPVFVVPKSLVAQWGNEFKNYFPAARLLVSDDKSFSKDNRRVFTNRISNGDYDAIILSYEQFEKVPMSAAFRQKFYQEQINDALDAIAEEKAENGEKSLTVKQMESKVSQLKKKIAEITTKAKDEDNIDFEQLGIDSLFVDEAHNFKNLEYTTRMTNVGGLGNAKGSQRAFDLYTKVRYLQGLNGGRGIVFATATPVMNSMAEMYIMQKYLQSDMLNQLGLRTFDAWAKQFGEVVNRIEVNPSGTGYRKKESFSKFRNIPELQLLFRSFSDVLTKVPGLKIPKMKGGSVKIVKCEPGQFQKDYMVEIDERAKRVKTVDPSVDNMLKITSDGRKAAYTQRMIDPSLPYEPGCKIYRCCDNVLTEYQESTEEKGTQIIFCDMATPKGKSSNANADENADTDTDTDFDPSSAKLYDDMKAYLVKRGIPASEIAFIHDAKTDAQKANLFGAVNDGTVRVLIGSTGKMGVGMNAQKRIVAIHHLDAPWRPGDVEQRDGRAFRQGNINSEVSKYVYVTEGSFDTVLWDKLNYKQEFINQIMNGTDVGRNAEDTGEVTLSAAEVMAVSSGNPLIKEKTDLETEISNLQSLKRAYNSSISAARSKLQQDETRIQTLKSNIANGKADIQNRVDTYSDGKFSMKLGKRTFTEKKDAGAILASTILSDAKQDSYTTIGKFAGFDMQVIKEKGEYHGLLVGKNSYPFNVYTENTGYMVNHIIGVAQGLETRIEHWGKLLTETEADRKIQENLISKPFEQQAELEAKTARYNEVMDVLNPPEEQIIGDTDSDTDDGDNDVQYQVREVVGESGKNYGIGVYLDSTLLDNLTESERVEMVKEYIKDIGGQSFTAYDKAGNEVQIRIAEPSERFTNQNKKRIPVNKDLTTKHRSNHTKQEAVVLIDELITASQYDKPKDATHSHGWLDNYGNNQWDYWNTYIQDKEKTVWVATLNVANTADGERILYDIDPIKMVEQRVESRTSTTADIVSQSPAESQEGKRTFTEEDGQDIQYSIREEAPPKETKTGYKVFAVKNGKLYPPMVANPNAEDTPVGVWLNADIGQRAPDSKTGRMQVKAGGKGTQGGSGSLAFRPGWHLGEVPIAKQFDRLNPETGEKELFPANFVWAECEIAADVDYQEEAMSYGYTASGKFQHSLAGLPRIPANGYYKYRTNPRPDTVPWLITGAMKVKRVLSDADVAQILREKGLEVPKRQGGEKTLADLGLERFEDIQYQERTRVLSDREVLSIAANEINVEGLTEAESSALDIFKSRLEKLADLTEKRLEEGRKYKEQQFGANGNREEAQKTLNRMKILDDQIRRANQSVLDVENKEVLRKVLQKARKVVEQQERAHGREILNRYRQRVKETAQIKKYRERIQKETDTLTKWILHPDNKASMQRVPDTLKNSVIGLLESIDFTSKRQLRGGDATKADAKFEEQLRKLKKALTDKSADELYSGYTDLPPHFMERLDTFIEQVDALNRIDEGTFVINRMTAEQLQTLYQGVRVVRKLITQMNSFLNNAAFQHVNEAGDSSIAFMAELGDKSRSSAAGDKMGEQLLWKQIRPAYAFERFGEGGKAMFREFMKAQDTLAFNAGKIKAFREQTYTDAEVQAWEKQTKTFTLGEDRVEIPVSYLMGLYELSKRPQAITHLMGAGLRVATYDKGKTRISDTGHTLTPGDITTLTDALTARQKEVADKLQHFMAEQGGEWGNYVSVKRFGIEQFGEKEYYPISSDGRHLETDASETPSNASLYALLNMSFTKELKENASNRVVLYSIFDVFANHMGSMAQYNAFALPVLDALKWLNYRQVDIDFAGNKVTQDSVRERMAKAFGAPTGKNSSRSYAESFVLNIIRAFNGTETQGISSDTPYINALHRYNMAQVAYNFRVVVQQPLAITRAGLLLDYGSILKGLSLSPAAIKANIWEMQQHSGIAAWKALGFYDVNISRGLTDIIKSDSTKLDKVSDFGMKGAEIADTVTWAAMWSACKQQILSQYGKTEDFYDRVTALFEDVIYKTQVVDSVITKSEFLRSKGGISRMFGSFMSEPVTTASMLIDSYDKYRMDLQRGMNPRQAWKNNRGMIARTAFVYSLGAVLLAGVTGLVDAWRDDDDYETFLEKWLESFKGNLIDELNPLSKLPFLNNFVEIIKMILEKAGVDTYGNEPNTFIGQIAEYLTKATEIVGDKVSGEQTNYTWYGAIYKLLQAASGLSGLPIAASTRAVVSAWNSTVGSFAPSLKVKTYDPGDKASIKYAYQDGYLTEEEAIQALLDAGVYTSENDAYWEVQSFGESSSSNYRDVYAAMESGTGFEAAVQEMTSHGYERDKVLSQVRTHIGQQYKNGEITRADALNLLKTYGGLSSAEAQKRVQSWDKAK